MAADMSREIAAAEDLPLRPHRRRSLHDTLRILLKRRWTVLAVFFALVGFAACYSFSATPIYQATTQLLIERQQPRVLDTRIGAQADYYPGEEFYQTQYKLLESPTLAKKVVDKLGLKTHPAFADLLRDLPPEASANDLKRAQEKVTAAVAEGLTVTPVRNSRLVNLSYQSPDPHLAARMANAFAEGFIDYSLDLRFAASQEAAHWLQQKLAEGRKKLEESEAKLIRYKRANNIVALEDKESITAQRLEHLNKELLAAQTKRLEAETRFQEVSQGRAIREVLTNPLIQTLKAEEAKIIAQISEMGKKYGEKHPRMIQLHTELGATRAKIGLEMSQISQSIKNEYKMAQVQEENLRKALEAQKDATQDLGEKGVSYRVLLRDVETNRALYENMLKSLKETTATENVPATNIRIVYAAAPPEVPVKPRKVRNLFLAVLLGAILGVAAALGLENLDTTLKTPEEVEGWLEIPSLAMIPHLDIGPGSTPQELPEVVVHQGQQPLVAEAYRSLRTSIFFATPGQAARTLLITSSLPKEGKSLTAANLAAVMAQAEPQVLLVDADLRRPSLHRLFLVEKQLGLSNFLVGEISDLPAVPTPIPHLFVVPCGHIPPNPSELLHSQRMQEFLHLAQKRFTRVILDSPPLMSVTDAAILATLVEGVILVVRAESVPRRAAMDSREQLLEVRANLLGALLNDIPLHRNVYSYYRHYYRYRASYTTEPGREWGKTGDQPATGLSASMLAWLKRKIPGQGRKECRP